MDSRYKIQNNHQTLNKNIDSINLKKVDFELFPIGTKLVGITKTLYVLTKKPPRCKVSSHLICYYKFLLSHRYQF